MQGKKKIIDAILQSAKKSAQTMIADVEQECKESDEALAVELDNARHAAEAEAKSAADAVYAGKIKLGELEAGKILLKRKRDIVDGVYDDVRRKILGMPDAQYLAMLARLIGEYAADGDEIVAARTDKRVTAAWVKKTAASCGKRLVLSGERGDFDMGVVLKNPQYERSLTVDDIVSDLRERTEADTVKALGL